MKLLILVLIIAAVFFGGITICIVQTARAWANDGLALPANVQVVDGANPGEVTISWDAAAGAAFYRIGWVNMDDYRAVRAEEGRQWLDVFSFRDVVNRGQTNQTLSDLEPGVQYAFIMASVGQRFGNAAGAWSEWTYLTTAAATSCPTNTGAEPGAPGGATPTPTPTPTPRPAPTGTGDYDADKDGLIEVSNLAQLAAIRTDLDGDGESSVPAAYAIAFPNAMPRMGCPNAGCTGYELVADLDFDTDGNGVADAGDAYWNNGAGWIPIGDDDHRFTADFDGNNHTIANLYINRRSSASPDYVGLFGYVSSSSIKRVGLVSATVSGSFHVGGLIGKISDSAISDSYATGTVSGYWAVGGLVGDSSDSAISASYAAGAVSANIYGGGLVGRSYSSAISASYATGAVSANTRVGGLVGDSSDSAISASYATGAVSGDDGVGGLVGWDSGTTINASYAVGRVSISGDTDTSNIGGLVGSGGRGFIIASYWDTESTGQAGSHGGVGKTTAELQSPVGYTGIYAGWNLDLDGDGNSDDPWHFGNSRQYPVLKYRGMDVGAQRR